METKRVATWLILGGLWIGAAISSVAQEEKTTGQSVRAEEIHDHDYAFSLRRPAKHWLLMDESTVRKVSPDAVAGARWKAGKGNICHGIVIVEKSPGMSLEALVDTVLENIGLENPQVKRRETTTLSGCPAISYDVVGLVNLVEFRHAATIFLHQGYAYQVNAWGLGRANQDGRALRDFHRAFSLRKGPVRGRTTVAGPTEASGVGWRLSEGVFESAVYRFTAVLPEGWRAFTGDELDNVNPDAEIGFSYLRESNYVTVTSEIVTGLEAERFLEQQLAAEKKGLESIPGPPLHLSCFGKKREFRVYGANEKQTITILLGRWIEGTICHTVMAWFPTHTRSSSLKNLEPMLGALRPLTASEVEKLAPRVAPNASHDEYVEMQTAIRNGVFHDFQFHATWTRPTKHFWRLHIGQAARENAQEARLWIEEPSRGLFGMLEGRELDAGDECDLGAIHIKALEEYDAARKAEHRKTVKLGAVQAISSEFTLRVDDHEFRYRVVTACTGKRALILVIWAFPGAFQAAGQAIDEAVQALRVLDRPFPMVERTDTEFLDHRLGFGWRHPMALEARITTSPAIRSMASAIHAGNRVQGINIIAVCSLNDRQDLPWFKNIVRQWVPDLVDRPGIDTFRSTRLAGRNALEAVAKGPKELDDLGVKQEYVILNQGRRFFGLVLFGDETFRKRARDGFHLLD